MATYSYEAKNKNGEDHKGEMVVADKRTLTETLRKKGLYLVHSEEKKKKKSLLDIQITTGVPLMEKVLFTRHLAIMLKSGLSLSRALGNLKDQTKNKYFKEILSEIYKGVESGKPLAESMSAYPRIFPSMFTSMINIGELSGSLDKVLLQLAFQMQRDYELIRKVKGAMYYPIVILTAMVGIAIMMVVFVMPKLTQIFDSFEADLPITTKMLIGASNFLIYKWPIAVGVLAVIVVLFVMFFKTEKGKQMSSMAGLKLPKVGMIIKEINTARFARSLSSMLKSGVPVVKALEITAASLGNLKYREALLYSAEIVKKGDSLSQGLAKFSNIFPPVVNQIISVGEETGSLDEILNEIASFYESEVDQELKNISSIIEPVLMLILGVGVAVVAVSVISPIYSLTGQI